MEERRLMDLARVVPETLLLVGTAEKVFASIKAAREQLGGDTWGYDDPDSPSSTKGGGGGYGVGSAPMKTAAGSLAGLRYDDTTPTPGFWADLLACALAPEGDLPAAYREVARLVSLHGEAGRVLALFAARLGIIQHGDGSRPDDEDAAPVAGLRPDHDAPSKRWRDLREAVVRHAHDALLALSAAASAVAAAEDVIRWRSDESPRRKEWSSAARQLVRGARRSLGEAKESVRLMRDAVMCEYFETWMILNRASHEENR